MEEGLIMVKKIVLYLLITITLTGCGNPQSGYLDGESPEQEFVIATYQNDQPEYQMILFFLNNNASDINQFELPIRMDGICPYFLRKICQLGDLAYPDDLTIGNNSSGVMGFVYQPYQNPTIGTIYLMNKDLQVQFCPPRKMPWVESSFSILSEHEILYVGFTDNSSGRIIKYRMDTCEIVEEGEREEGLIGVVQSEHLDLVKVFFREDNLGDHRHFLEIFKENDSAPFEVMDAYMPNFSEDSTLLSYINARTKKLTVVDMNSNKAIFSELPDTGKIEYYVWQDSNIIVLILEDNQVLSLDVRSQEIAKITQLPIHWSIYSFQKVR